MRFRCYDCYLKSRGDREYSEWNGDIPTCQRCKATAPMVVPLVDIHLVISDPNGPIVTGMGRFRMACRPMRDKLATKQVASMTGDPSAVTCLECKRTKSYREALEKRKTVTLRGPKADGPCC